MIKETVDLKSERYGKQFSANQIQLYSIIEI